MDNKVGLFIVASAVVAGLGNASTAQDQASAIEGHEQLDEIVIVGTRQERYNFSSTTVGRLDSDILTNPRSIVVLPEQLLLDQQINTISDALVNVAGVTQSDGLGGTKPDNVVRGFIIDTYLRNGVRVQLQHQPSPQNIDSIELLKGPVSVFYGQSDTGGVVNINTKKPQFEPRTLIQSRFDEHGHKLLTVDTTAPWGESETVAYRLNAAIERTKTFRDFSEVNREFISPSILWRPREDLNMVFTYEYSTDDRPLDRGFVSLPDGQGGRFIPENIPVSRRFGEDFEVRDVKIHTFDTAIDYTLNDNWTLKASALYEVQDAFDVQVRPRSIDAEGNLTRRVDGFKDRETSTNHFSLYALGKLATGSIEHDIVVGVESNNTRETFKGAAQGTVGGFNIFNPVYGLIVDERQDSDFTEDLIRNKSYGVFIQDRMHISEKLSLHIGGRFDSAEGLFTNNAGAPFGFGIIDDYSVDKVTGQGAIVYQPTENSTVYFSYSQGFDPKFQFSAFGSRERFDPTEGEQFEVGVKANFLENRLNITAAVYELTKSNIVGFLDGTSQFIGDVRSRGLELTATGEPIPGLNFIASYSYLDNDILTESADKGNRNANVAKHTARIWASYEAREGRVKGLGFGAGVNYTGDRFGDTANTWSLGSFTVVDTALWYYLQVRDIGITSDMQVRLSVNAKNLFDKRHFLASGGDLRINIGQPRTITGQVSFLF